VTEETSMSMLARKPMNVRELIESKQDHILLACVDDYEVLERTGALPDTSILRDVCREAAEGTGQSTMFWFEAVIKEVFRSFVYRYIDLCD
jgi:hypothetical protein